MERVVYSHLATPLDGDRPAGDDPEYDSTFLNITKSLQPAARGMIADAPEADADPVDWNVLRADALGLAESTRDLRLTMRMARMALHDAAGAGGVGEFAGCITLAADLLDGMWDDVHPVLDEEDDMDATMRSNALGDLDDIGLLNLLLDAPVAARGRAKVTLRDLEIALGKRDPGADTDPAEVSTRIASVFDPNHSDELVTALDAVRDAREALERISAIWQERMNAVAQTRYDQDLRFDNLPPPNVERLGDLLGTIIRLVSDRLPEPEEDAEGEDGEGAEGGATAAASGAIRNREDADAQLRRIITWFQRNEPSSPVPALLERARSMISKSFLEIIDELGDGGISEARRAYGANTTPDEM